MVCFGRGVKTVDVTGRKKEIYRKKHIFLLSNEQKRGMLPTLLHIDV